MAEAAKAVKLPAIWLGRSMLDILKEEWEGSWIAWLERYHLRDVGMRESAQYMRYKKFKGLDLGPLVPEEEKWRYF